jgi:hypothetical protein
VRQAARFERFEPFERFRVAHVAASQLNARPTKFFRQPAKGAAMTEYKEILYQKQRGGVLITMNRPEALNAITRPSTALPDLAPRNF